MNKKENILFGLILFFIATLALPWLKLASIFSAIFLGFYSFFFNDLELFPSIGFKAGMKQLFRNKRLMLKDRRYVQWMVLFVAIVIVSVFSSFNRHAGLRYLDPRLPLVYFPVSVGLMNIQRATRDRILLGFAWLTVAVMLLCLGDAIRQSQFFRHPEFLYNDSLTAILRQQSIYISLLVNLSIYVFTYHVVYTGNRYKLLMIAAIVFLFVMSYLLASRNLMLVLYVFTVGFAMYSIVTRKKYVQGAVLLACLAGGFILVLRLFPKTLNRYKELAYTQFNYQSTGPESHYNMDVTADQWNGANFRMAAWRCGWELFLAHPVTGVGIGDKKDMLMQKYREKDFVFALQTKKNVHNNYLDILYSLGLVGLAVFLVAWVILPVIRAVRWGDNLALLVITTFAIAWVTEIYFDRSLGGMLTGFFIPFLLADKKTVH